MVEFDYIMGLAVSQNPTIYITLPSHNVINNMLAGDLSKSL